MIAVKIMRPGVRERFARDIQAMRFMARIVEALRPEAERLRPREVVETLARSVAMEMDLRLEGRPLGTRREHQGRSEFGCRNRSGTDRARRAGERVDRRHPPQRPGGDRRGRPRRGGPRPDRDPVLPAPRDPGRLLPRRHASRKPVRRSGRAARRGRFRHHGPARAEGAPLPRRNPARFHPARLPPGGGGAFRGRLRPLAPLPSTISRRRSGRSASRSTSAGPTRSRWRRS